MVDQIIDDYDPYDDYDAGDDGDYHDDDDDNFQHCSIFIIIITSYGLNIILILVNCVAGGLQKPGGCLKVTEIVIDIGIAIKMVLILIRWSAKASLLAILMMTVLI